MGKVSVSWNGESELPRVALISYRETITKGKLLKLKEYIETSMEVEVLEEDEEE